MPNEAYDAWVKSTFDVDPSRYAADGPTPNDAAPAAGTTPPAAPTTAPPSPAGPDDPRKAILASIATIHAEAKFLKDAGVDSSPIETEAAKLQTRLDATDKLADTPQRQADFQTLAADAKTAWPYPVGAEPSTEAAAP